MNIIDVFSISNYSIEDITSGDRVYLRALAIGTAPEELLRNRTGCTMQLRVEDCAVGGVLYSPAC